MTMSKANLLPSMKILMTEREWERQMESAGIKRFEDRIADLEGSAREAETPYGLRTTGLNVERLAQAIAAYVAEPDGEGRPPVAKRRMQALVDQLGPQW